MKSRQYASHPHVAQRQGVRSGAPCVEGTAVRVIHLLRMSRAGASPEKIGAELGLPAESVCGALAFARLHADELDAEEREREGWVEHFHQAINTRAN